MSVHQLDAADVRNRLDYETAAFWRQVRRRTLSRVSLGLGCWIRVQIRAGYKAAAAVASYRHGRGLF